MKPCHNNWKIGNNFTLVTCGDLNIDLSEKYRSTFLMFFASFLTFSPFFTTLPWSRVRRRAFRRPCTACSALSTGAARREIVHLQHGSRVFEKPSRRQSKQNCVRHGTGGFLVRRIDCRYQNLRILLQN